MRLRTIMTIVFCISAAAPMLLFWLWPHSWFLDNKKDEVKQQHLVIASSLASELDRYHRELTRTFEIAVEHIDVGGDYKPLSRILDNLDIKHICVADYDSGKVFKSIQTDGPECPGEVSRDRFEWLKAQVGDQMEMVVTTPVIGHPEKGNVIYTLYRKGDRLFMGAVSTNYVASVGRRISIGEMGHAAIFDQKGQALSHPNLEWQKARENLSRIHIVQKMLKGGSGVETFYSPALEKDMIAGYAHVPSAGWAIMVPQPISELEREVAAFKYTTFTIMTVGLFIAVILAYIASKLLTYPLEQMIQTMQRIGNGELRAHEQMKSGYVQPLEFDGAREAIEAMASKLQENIDTISRHAYLDGITGLPNRECFKVLAQEYIERLELNGEKGAVLFLDLDGFKQINDVYGHRSGDDLLKGFADKIHLYCGNEMKRRARGAENAVNILPARLGGDEFVIFLGNVSNYETVVEFANGLFSKVFGKFKLHNGVSLQVNGSVGGALFPDQGSDFDELLRLADIAMYKAKNGGKGRFCLHKEGDDLTIKDAAEPFLDA